MSQIDDLIERCDKFLTGPLDENEMYAIASDFAIAYAKPVGEYTGGGIGIDKLIRAEINPATIRSMRTMLVAYRDHLDYELALCGAPSTTVIAQAHAEARATVTIDQVFKMVDDAGGLPDEQLTQLKDLIAGMQSKAAMKDEKGFAEKLKAALDIAERAAGLIPAVVSAIKMVAPLFGA